MLCSSRPGGDDSGRLVNGTDPGDHLHEEEAVLDTLHHVETVVHSLELQQQVPISLQCLLDIQHPVRPVAWQVLELMAVLPHQNACDIFSP